MTSSSVFKKSKTAEIIGAFGRHNDGSTVVPLVHASAWRGKTVFLRALQRVERRIVNGEPGGTYEEYFNEDKTPYHDECVICKEKIPDYVFASPDFEWYSTLQHYVKDHNFQPAEAFIVFAQNFAADGFVPPAPRRKQRKVAAIEKLLRAVENQTPSKPHVQDVLQVFRNYFQATMDAATGGLPAKDAVDEIRKARLDFKRDWQALGLPDVDWSWDARL